MRARRERQALQQERVDRREMFEEEEKVMGEKMMKEQKEFGEGAKE